MTGPSAGAAVGPRGANWIDEPAHEIDRHQTELASALKMTSDAQKSGFQKTTAGSR